MKRPIWWIFTTLTLGIAVTCAILLLWGWVQNWPHNVLASKLANSNVPIEFFGVVVDQDGRPIADAEVTLSIARFDPSVPITMSSNYIKRFAITRVSDLQGRFSVRGERGSALYIEKVVHPDFLAIPERNWTYERYRKYLGFDYWDGSGNMIYVPDESNPAVLVLRKKGENRILGLSKGGSEKKMPHVPLR